MSNRKRTDKNLNFLMKCRPTGVFYVELAYYNIIPSVRATAKRNVIQYFSRYAPA